MNTEQKLIIALLGATAESEINSLLSKEIDWSRFVKTARNHRLVPAIFQNTNALSLWLPDDVMAELRLRSERSAFRNLEFYSELKNLEDILDQSGAEYFSYKGLTLAQLAYGDPSLRSFGDLDLFIRKKDFPKVKETLIKNGGVSAWNLSPKQERAVLKYYYEYPVLFGKRQTTVELHWAFMESFFGFDYEKEDVFGRSQKVVVHGREFRTLSNEDLLIILCVHGSKHYWKRVSWIYDIAKLIHAQPINWDMVIRRARKFGSFRMVNLGLVLAKDLFNVELPDEIEKYLLNDRKIPMLAESLKHEIFNDAVSAEKIRSRIHLMMLERWRDKFTYSRRLFRTKVIDSIFMPMGRPT